MPRTQVEEDEEEDEEDGRGEVMKEAWWNEDVKSLGRHTKSPPHPALPQRLLAWHTSLATWKHVVAAAASEVN